MPNMKSSVKELRKFVDDLDTPLQRSFQNLHGGDPDGALERFLQARDEDVTRASKMLLDCLNWRVSNNIDGVLSSPILPKEKFDAIRRSQLIGFCGFCKQGRPVFAIGVGNSTFDQASVDNYVQSHIQINEYRDRILLPEISTKKGRPVGSCVKVLDMTGLRLSAFRNLKTSTAIATVDDLNYPEKTDTYYIVNAPLVFSACWRAVKPLLQERTRRKVQVLRGNGREELLQVMHVDALPPFCRSGSPSYDVFSADHQFHAELYQHIEENVISSGRDLSSLASEGSLSIRVPSPEEHSVTSDVVHAIETVLPNLQTASSSSSEQNQRSSRLAAKMAGIKVST